MYLVSVTRKFCSLTDDGEHWLMCDRIGTVLTGYRRNEIPEVRLLAGITPAGT